MVYVNMGYTRSMNGLRRKMQELFEAGADVPSRRVGTLKDWARFYQWADRIEAHEKIVSAESRARWEDRLRERWEKDWEMGGSLREKAEQYLISLSDFLFDKTVTTPPTKPGDPIVEHHYMRIDVKGILTMIELASKLQAGAGPSSNPGLPVVLNIDYSTLSDEKLRRIRDGEDALAVISSG